MENPEPTAGACIELTDLNQWLEYQLGQWNKWAAGRDEDWLALETGNPQWPTAADMLMHAFSPLHRYADTVLGVEPEPQPEPANGLTWEFICDWAVRCLRQHRQAVSQLDPANPGQLVTLNTRSMGPVQARSTRCLAHAATHAAWHLGGIIHLLRRAGSEPPQRSDLLYWGVAQEDQSNG
jgi:uncharacterized damage-inducible protein DinB